MSRGFEFRESWTVAASRDRVHGLLIDLEHYPDWWPEVRAVAKVDDDHAWVLCRSTLPYTIDLLLTAVHREPDLLETTIGGDLVGTVRWRLSDHGAGTRLDYEQHVDIGSRVLRAAAVPLRPLFTWNHGWMMAGCLAGMRQALA
ncbi:MAG: SRPBCC family protein [Nocardioides sp.]